MSVPTVLKTLRENTSIETVQTLGGHNRVSERDFRVYLGLEESTTETTTSGKKVLIVTRVSTVTPKSSLEQQEKDCREWVKENIGKCQIEVNSRVASGLLSETIPLLSLL